MSRSKTASKRKAEHRVSIDCSEVVARKLLYLVIDRICVISNDWSRKANTERKGLEASRKALDDALINHMIAEEKRTS